MDNGRGLRVEDWQMAKFTVVALKHGFPSTGIERNIITAAGGDLIDTDGLPDQASALHAAETAEGLLVRWTAVTAEIISRLRRCRVIVRYGIGYDNVDYESATAANIIISHSPTYCVDEVATHALALLLACVRDIVTTHNKLAAGGWNPNPLSQTWRMAGRTFGLLGLGNIGRAVAKKVAGWDMRLLATDPYIEPERASAIGVELVDLTTLCRESDYLSLHVPLLPETRHIIGEAEFRLMKPGVILVNTSRGPVLETVACLAALESGRVRAMGLDVFEEEPLPEDSRLREHPNVVLSDHAAWYSEDALKELRQTVAEEAVRACTGGLPVAIANPEVLHKLGRFKDWTPNENARWRARRAEVLRRR